MNKFFAFILSLFLVIAPVSSSNKAYASSGGGGAGSYAKIILGMANSIVGSTIIMKCTISQPSLLIYMAGSLVYVAAELIGGNKKKQDVKSGAKDFENTKNTMKEGGDLQRAALQKQLENEKSNLDHAQKKKTWMTATLAVYAAATAAAVIEAIIALTNGGSDLAGCAPNPSHIPIQVAISYAYVGLSGYAGSGAVGAALSMAMYHFGPKLLAMIGIGTTAMDLAVTALTSAYGRIAVFLAATILVGVITAGISSEISEIQKKIKKIEEALKQFDNSSNELAEGTGTGNGTGAEGSSSGSDAGAKDKAKENVADTKTFESNMREAQVNELSSNKLAVRKCFSSASGSMEYSEGGCKKSVVLNRVKLNSELTTPLLDSATNAAMDLGNAVASGDTAAADVQAAKLASMATKLEALKDNYVAKFNDTLKKEGKKPINGNDEVNRQVAAFESALKEKGILKANSFDDLDKMLASQAKDKTGIDQTKVPKQEVITIGGDNKGKSEEERPKKIDFSVSDMSTLSEGVKEDPTLSSRLDEFEDSGSEISKDSGRSIFEQVSNRYIHSLPRLLKRRETPTPLESK